MPLVISREGDVDRPIIVCDHCGEPITNAKDGNYQWLIKDVHGEDTTNPPIVFTHKRCSRAFEMERGRPVGAWWAWGPLPSLPIYLMTNLGMGQKEEREAREWVRTLSSL